MSRAHSTRHRATAVSLLGLALAAAGAARARPLAADSFRVKPRHPIADLRREAMAASPPHERARRRAVDLVELVRLDPTIRLEIRYATADNFLGAPVYSEARAFLQRPAAEALLRVHRALRSRGYGLLVHDAYRPWWATKLFWDATSPAQHRFLADPAKGSRHNRGCAVDLTLCALADGHALAMPSAYDELTERAAASYRGGTEAQRAHRDRLREAMEAEGYRGVRSEWWHFDYRQCDLFPILNQSFSEIRGAIGRSAPAPAPRRRRPSAGPR